MLHTPAVRNDNVIFFLGSTTATNVEIAAALQLKRIININYSTFNRVERCYSMISFDSIRSGVMLSIVFKTNCRV